MSPGPSWIWVRLMNRAGGFAMRVSPRLSAPAGETLDPLKSSTELIGLDEAFLMTPERQNPSSQAMAQLNVLSNVMGNAMNWDLLEHLKSSTADQNHQLHCPRSENCLKVQQLHTGENRQLLVEMQLQGCHHHQLAPSTCCLCQHWTKDCIMLLERLVAAVEECFTDSWAWCC
ncbi:hypothetical protein Y1Q_0011841 [Alligator mississippiensis]|uniref:Uncharacterized protein n=1 Tax=Alligator mississippiensis TaxID=8496 RepID=A0A151LYP2_ALLMI|nr:hypothetical protein Y1Q_0011841 [Alligator mississippiensis]